MSDLTSPDALRGALPLSYFASWLAAGERGISSEAIVSCLTSSRVGRSRFGSDWPHDPADFRRCQLLLNSHPLARFAFGAMRDASPQWARLVDSWDEIHEAIPAEVPDYLSGRAHGSAPIAYRLMRRVIEGGDSCADCNGTGRARPCEKCKGTGRRSGGKCRAREPYCLSGYVSCDSCRGEGFIRKRVA